MATQQKAYPGDMTEAQAELLLPLIPAAKKGGRPRSVDIVSVINAQLYVLCTGCAWRWLPHDYPPYGTVYDYFRKWQQDGTWVKIHDHLRDWVRTVEGRHADASAGILDSQSVKTATMINQEVGYDAGKQIRRKKEIYLSGYFWLVDSDKCCGSQYTRERRRKKNFRENERAISEVSAINQDFCGWWIFRSRVYALRDRHIWLYFGDRIAFVEGQGI